MVRWSYILPRLFILLAVVMFLWIGVSPLVRWSLLQSGQAAMGVQLDIETVEASVWNSNLTMQGVQVPNPRKPRKNIFQFETADLDIDGREFLMRRVLVRQGRITGLRVDSQRDTSAELDSTADTDDTEFDVSWDEELAEQGRQWLENLGSSIDQDLEDNLESVRLAKELARRWPEEYDQLKTRSERVESSIRELKELYERIRKNPAGEADKIPNGLAKLDELHREMDEIRRELPRLSDQAAADRIDLDAARRRDEQRIRSIIVNQEIDAQSITNYLLGPELSGRVAEWTGYLESGRQVWDIVCNKPEAARGRGIDILLPGMRKNPNFLIQQLSLDGIANENRTALHFIGQANDVTNEPKLYGKPAKIRLKTSGAAQLEINAVVDRTGQHPLDRVHIRCPEFSQMPNQLGKPDEFAVSVHAAPANLAIVTDIRGNEIDGWIVITQRDVKLKPQLASKYGGPGLAKRIEAAVDSIDSLDTKVKLSGTIRKPKLRLQSDLGEKLADSFQRALQVEVEHQKQRLALEADKIIQQHLHSAERIVAEKKVQLMEKLEISGDDLDAMQQKLVGRFGLPGGMSEKLIGRSSRWMENILR